MLVLINTIYSVILGLACSHFVTVKVHGESTPPSVKLYLDGANGLRVLLVLALFLCDWGIFMFLFGAQGSTPVPRWGYCVLILYVPALMALGFSFVAAIESAERPSRYLAFYHGLSFVLEAGVVLARVEPEATYKGTELVGSVLILLVYFLIRSSLAFLHYIRYPYARIEALVFVGILAKPCFVILLAKASPTFGQLLGV